jgi:hypothetical protein
MNRDIKFRGWFKGINGKGYWAYGYLLKQQNGNWEITNGEITWTVDNVGQFTGVIDSLGKEIYEGDKVVYTLKNDSSLNEIEGKIEWHNHAWRLSRIWLLSEIITLKVIGEGVSSSYSLDLPNTIQELFENGEQQYSYYSEDSMDNNWALDWFIKHLNLSEFIKVWGGNQIIVKHPNYQNVLQIDAGGLGDFHSHSFNVSI